jgi:dihydroneopterin aldolase
MTLNLESLAVDCIIGDLPEERLRPQRLTVDVSLRLPDAAADSDDLADTVDYAELAEKIRRALVAAECRMIERAAKIVLGLCLENPLVASAGVKVVKRGAVPGLEAASVVMEAER